MGMKIRKDDKVVVLSGRDKGKEGKVLSADPKNGKVIVEFDNPVRAVTKGQAVVLYDGIVFKVL